MTPDIVLTIAIFFSYVNKDRGDIGKNGTVHIFSVATGRLYERFLRYVVPRLHAEKIRDRQITFDRGLDSSCILKVVKRKQLKIVIHWHILIAHSYGA